jgi:hypothetical protein
MLTLNGRPNKVQDIWREKEKKKQQEGVEEKKTQYGPYPST